jgi:hypothetical protein
MSEEEKDYDYDIPKNKLVEIIDSCLCVITTLTDLDSMAAKEDADDILALRKHSYKVIYAAQRKMLKQIKSD